MDGVSIAASILGIATAGLQVSTKLVTLAAQINTAPKRVSSIANDVALTSGVLHQLGELMTQNTADDGTSIFSQGGLEITRSSAAVCRRIFEEIEKQAGRASEQLRTCRRLIGGNIELSTFEKLRWPFLRPFMQSLRMELKEAKGTLMLVLQVTSLALLKKMADQSTTTSFNMVEQRDTARAILAMHQQQQQVPHREGKQLAEPRQTSCDGNDEPTLPYVPTGISTKNESASAMSKASSSPIPVMNSFMRPRSPKVPLRSTGSDIAGSSIGTSDHGIYRSNENINGSGSSGDPDQGEGQNARTSTFHNASAESSCSRPVSSALPTPSSTSLSESSRDPLRPTSESPARIDTVLRRFILEPVIKDYFDKIELSWSIHKTGFLTPALHAQISQQRLGGLPPVKDMLEILSGHERATVFAQLTSDGIHRQEALLSLKRTRTDIQHRDITFKGVPGLQFVIESKDMQKQMPVFKTYLSSQIIPPRAEEECEVHGWKQGSEGGEEETVQQEADEEERAIVEDLLGKYTTLFD